MAIPSVRLTHSLDQAIPTGVSTVLTFDTENFDTDNMHDLVTNPERVTINTAGKYHVGGAVQIEANSSGEKRQLFVRLNGSLIIANSQLAKVNTGAEATIIQASTVFDLAASDFVELLVMHDQGAALDVETANAYSPIFWAHEIASTAPVDSVFGRIGVVVAALSDYDASQIDNDSSVAGATVKDALDQLSVSTSLPAITIALQSIALDATAAVAALNSIDASIQLLQSTTVSVDFQTLVDELASLIINTKRLVTASEISIYGETLD